MRALRSSPLTTVALICLSIFVLSLAAIQVYKSVLYADLAYWAERLNAHAVADKKSVTALAAQARDIPIKECQTRFVKAATDIILFDLDNQSPYSDYDTWADGIQAAQQSIQHSLGCTPTDGNLWLRLAMVRQAIAENASDLSWLLALSYRYAPAEDYVVVGRFMVYNRMTEIALEASSAAISNDIRYICSESRKALRDHLPTLKRDLATYARKVSPGCAFR